MKELTFTQADKTLIPFIFQLMKKLFFKPNKSKENKGKRPSVLKENDPQFMMKIAEANAIMESNLNLMRSFLDKSLDFLKEEYPPEIIVAILHFIFKFFEEVVPNFYTEGKKKISVFVLIISLMNTSVW